MSKLSSKRTIDHLEDDSDDEDWDLKSRAKKKSRKAAAHRTQPISQTYRSKGVGYESDEDGSIEDSVERSSVSSPPNPRSSIDTYVDSGRPSRRAAKKQTYQEPESDIDSADSQLTTKKISRIRNGGKRVKKSLIVTLVIPGLLQNTQTAHETNNQPDSRTGSRRSTRRIQDFQGHTIRTPIVSTAHVRSRTPSATPLSTDDVNQNSPGAHVSKELYLSDVLSKGNGRPDANESRSSGGDASLQVDADASNDINTNEDIPETVGEIDQEGHETREEEESPNPVIDRQARRAFRRHTLSSAGSFRHRENRIPSSRRVDGDSSDFDPTKDMPASGESSDSYGSPRKDSQRSEASSHGRKTRRLPRKRTSPSGAASFVDEDDGDEAEELAEELADLKASQRGRQRKRKKSMDQITYEAPRRRTRGDRLDYTIRPEMWPTGEEDEQSATQYSRTVRAGKTGTAYRSLWTTQGPFGFAGGPSPRLTGLGVATLGADSDSSDEDTLLPPNTGGSVPGMHPPIMPIHAQFGDTHQNNSNGLSNLGKITSRKSLADADPLGVDQNVGFDDIGGLKTHINQLKEMVILPLLYPEIFSRFHITPPRGVLFHGPPGTGKTLLARALANSVSSQGKKVAFYMRKGADTLSKYVGEAERQLRLLFEDARKNQPSIIFFDEIDGLAPVRSSKQDQIHATIVTTLLALMDGMDGRGQVIVIGATNRPDTVDSALRRPGRFDREFYFPLPDEDARRSIIDIQTAKWQPPLSSSFKDQLAAITNGYGGADLRALCTEATLNAVQATYPQIYHSNEKLKIDPRSIKVLAKDFLNSIDKMVPSSQRATGSNSAPLHPRVDPLLRDDLKAIAKIFSELLPLRKRRDPLEEAQYETRDNGTGFEKEMLLQTFDQARVFRPRLLLYGQVGMGQQILGRALLHKFEGFHVQSFDLSVLLEDSSRTTQAAIVQLFKEAKHHKPSIIFIPNIELWYSTIEPTALTIFIKELQSLSPNEPILLFATLDLESNQAEPNSGLSKDLFSFSSANYYRVERPDAPKRREYFAKIVSMIKMNPREFPSEKQHKRMIPQLEKVLETASPGNQPPSKGDLKRQKRADRAILNMLKIKLGLIMDQLKNAYKSFRRPPIDQEAISYLYDDQISTNMSSDLSPGQHEVTAKPFMIGKDEKGIDVIREVATGKSFYNLELVTIERRLSNGYYKRPKDFVADIKRLNKDAKTLGDSEKILKSNLMLANVEVDVHTMFDIGEPLLLAQCENLYRREAEREGKPSSTGHPPTHQGPDLSNIDTRDQNPSSENSMQDLTNSTPARVSAPLVHGLKQSIAIGSVSDFSSGNSESMKRISPQAPYGFKTNDLGSAANAKQSFPETDAQAGRLSQSAFITPMTTGARAQDYQNSASTTTSEHKASKSRSSGHNTQSTNGVNWNEQPDLNLDINGGSQLPDTQENAYNMSQETQLQPAATMEQDQPPKPPQLPQPRSNPTLNAVDPQRTSISCLLNSPPVTSGRNGEDSLAPLLIVDDSYLSNVHEDFVTKSSGLSVEQLEQVHASLMNTLWFARDDWNRVQVTKKVADTFNEVIADIERMQEILRHSQEEKLF